MSARTYSESKVLPLTVQDEYTYSLRHTRKDGELRPAPDHYTYNDLSAERVASEKLTAHGYGHTYSNLSPAEAINMVWQHNPYGWTLQYKAVSFTLRFVRDMSDAECENIANVYFRDQSSSLGNAWAFWVSNETQHGLPMYVIENSELRRACLKNNISTSMQVD